MVLITSWDALSPLSEKVIVAERTFNTRAAAEEYIITKNEFIS